MVSRSPTWIEPAASFYFHGSGQGDRCMRSEELFQEQVPGLRFLRGAGEFSGQFPLRGQSGFGGDEPVDIAAEEHPVVGHDSQNSRISGPRRANSPSRMLREARPPRPLEPVRSRGRTQPDRFLGRESPLGEDVPFLINAEEFGIGGRGALWNNRERAAIPCLGFHPRDSRFAEQGPQSREGLDNSPDTKPFGEPTLAHSTRSGQSRPPNESEDRCLAARQALRARCRSPAPARHPPWPRRGRDWERVRYRVEWRRNRHWP